MLFHDPIFAVFLPLVLIGFGVLSGPDRTRLLLLASYVFYGWWDWRFLSLLWISTLVDYFCGLAIENHRGTGKPRSFLTISLVTNLGLLGVFKYFDFFSRSAAIALGTLGIDVSAPLLDIALPMGISFYTFQSMSYTIDVYRGARAERSLPHFALFVACFPQLVAGPIVRADYLLPQLHRVQKTRESDLSAGALRFFVGLFKKAVIADTLAVFVDRFYDDPAGYAGVSAWIAVYAYAMQIYMDFSGYTDMAIGIGRMLGLRLPENFNRPYLASSPRDFWRRWHITLSTWLRDYLYIPLGGSRGSAWFTGRNLLVTMLLGGLWHGPAWTFVAWGVFHGLLLVLQRGCEALRASYATARLVPRIPRWLGTLLTLHAVCFGWILFRSGDWATVGKVLASLLDFDGPILGKRYAVVVAMCFVAHMMPGLDRLGHRVVRWHPVGRGALAGLICWAVLLLTPDVRAFIYFQF